MQHDEFIGQVQNRAHLDSRGAAERATRATLETLAERIPAGLAGNVAAQLPPEIGEHFHRVEAAPDEPLTGERFERKEFVRRVSERSGADEPQAAHEARVVMAVVDEATSGGLMDKLGEALPADVNQFLQAERGQ